MHLTLFEVLSLLRSAPGDAAALLARLETLTSGAPSLPALYRHVRRGLDEGWIEVEGLDTADVPGRPPQRYRITPAGEAALRERARELNVFTRLALDDGGSGG